MSVLAYLLAAQPQRPRLPQPASAPPLPGAGRIASVRSLAILPDYLPPPWPEVILCANQIPPSYFAENDGRSLDGVVPGVNSPQGKFLGRHHSHRGVMRADVYACWPPAELFAAHIAHDRVVHDDGLAAISARPLQIKQTGSCTEAASVHRPYRSAAWSVSNSANS